MTTEFDEMSSITIKHCKPNDAYENELNGYKNEHAATSLEHAVKSGKNE
jgi:hypothetical protein